MFKLPELLHVAPIACCLLGTLLFNGLSTGVFCAEDIGCNRSPDGGSVGPGGTKSARKYKPCSVESTRRVFVKHRNC